MRKRNEEARNSVISHISPSPSTRGEGWGEGSSLSQSSVLSPQSLIALLVVLFFSAGAAFADTIDATPLRPLPCLDHGRVKPIDTVARETVRFITNCEYFGDVTDNADGQQEVSTRVDPLNMVLDWAAHPVAWQTKPVLYVSLIDLRTKLGMHEADQWIAPRTIMENTTYTAWVAGLEQQRMLAEQKDETVIVNDPREKRLDDAAVELDERMRMFESAGDLSLYFIVPSEKPNAWVPLSALLTMTGEQGEMAGPIRAGWTSLLDAYKRGDNAAFATASAQLSDAITQQVGGSYADTARLDREVFYNGFKPFRWAWVIYFVTTGALVTALMIRRKSVYVGAMSLFALAILLHFGGFLLRCSITGWAPVTNMYETVIWVAMMGAVFSYVLELIYRRRVIAIGGAVVAVLATVVADFIPPEYGSAFENLNPVLRSNYWLAIHVLTIVSSYAAFALALILGNIVLGQFIHGGVDRAEIQQNLLFTYRAVQIGALLVLTGTILGGLWATVSWGKFWSWDPKEVWALIVFLVYLALLHGRYAGWIKQFGMAAGAVICFTAVLMSWYGVNFVLGAGLHSYGFGSGGEGYVFSFVGLQWIYVLIAWIVYRGRQRMQAEAAEAAEEPLPRGMPVTGK